GLWTRSCLGAEPRPVPWPSRPGVRQSCRTERRGHVCRPHHSCADRHDLSLQFRRNPLEALSRRARCGHLRRGLRLGTRRLFPRPHDRPGDVPAGGHTSRQRRASFPRGGSLARDARRGGGFSRVYLRRRAGTCRAAVRKRLQPGASISLAIRTRPGSAGNLEPHHHLLPVYRQPAQHLSVVLPAYREGPRIHDNLRLLLTELDKLDHNYEVVVVSDGSPDETAAEAQRVASAHVKVLDYPSNMGKGYALCRGFEA